MGSRVGSRVSSQINAADTMIEILKWDIDLVRSNLELSQSRKIAWDDTAIHL